MSHRATNWAIAMRGIPARAKIVLIQLADRHNKDTGRCDPSQELLAADCEMPRSTLNVQLKLLEDRGLISRVKRFDETTKRQRSTSYVLHFDAPVDDGSRVQKSDTGAVSRNEPDPCPDSGASRVQNLDTNPVREPGREPVLATDAAHTAAFEEFWNAYPRARRREVTERLFSDAVNGGEDPRRLIKAAKRYRAENDGNKPMYLCQSDTWLRNRRWEDYPAEAEPVPCKSDIAAFWAETIKAGKFVPANAINTAVAANMLERGLVSQGELRAAGVGA